MVECWARRRTVGLEEVAGEELRDIAAGLKECLARYGGTDSGKLGDVLDEAPDALQAARKTNIKR